MNLKYYSKDIHSLIICTDNDREGEAIGFDIAEVCKQKQYEYGEELKVFRAKFYSLHKEVVKAAFKNLCKPNKWLA